MKRSKRNDNLLPKIVVSFWPARRDSNPRPSESESAAISSFATSGNIKYIGRLNAVSLCAVTAAVYSAEVKALADRQPNNRH